MKYRELSGGAQFTAIEKEILAHWQKNQVFETSLRKDEDRPHFTFYEGPPTANGRPGIHHVMARTVKDLFCRYKTLKGYKVGRKAGWDTHGLPVEIEVEKELGLQGRSQVEQYGVAEYNKRCKTSVLKYKDQWDTLTNIMGYWVDLNDPYITFENNYIESNWWALKTLYEKGLLYKGYKIQWYSPGSATVLSSHEVSLGYKEVQDPSVYISFTTDEDPDTSFLAWTTTPWTLVSNMALAVHPKLDYVKIQFKETGKFVWLAQARLSVIKEEYELVATCKGTDLIGKTYQPLFDYALKEVPKDQAWRVIAADFVTTEDGTGIVHQAPAYGADDYDVTQKNGIPLYNPINRDGCFEDKIDIVAGLWFKDADKVIARNLKDRGHMYRHETYLHNYPMDWRKGTPLMSYPVESWFIRTTAVKDRMVELNNRINWKPASTGTGRFGTWLENNVDWAISRQRFWGTPIPIWVSDKDPGYIEVIGSVAELKAKAGIPADQELDLHRPYIDELTWPGPDGSTMKRIPDLLDVWFDSGAMPFSQWHYPFEKQEKFKLNFPADFIAEGVDQTRGWFYTLHALGTMLFDNYAFKNVVSNGLVLDAKGEKMSKTKGNTVNPFEIIEQFGADSLRWYMISNSNPWENLKFNLEGLKETQRKFFNTLMNTYQFFAMYANIDGFHYDGKNLVPVSERTELDQWIISRLNSIIRFTDENFNEYEPTRAARELEEFMDEVSNWYVRRSRRRFWKEGTAKDKLAAYQTLFECLETLSRLISPVAPFVSDWLYLNLMEGSGKKVVSVHLSEFPVSDESLINQDLEYRMAMARGISSIVLRIRNKVSLNVRQPLKRIMIPVRDPKERRAIDKVRDVIVDEINVKSIEYIDDDSGIVQKTAKPNFKKLGARFGKNMGAVTEAVKLLSGEQLSRYEIHGSLTLNIAGSEEVFAADDIEVIRKDVEGWLVESEGRLTVALDTELNEELISEGLAREFVNRVQNLRKESGFEVTDRIRIYVEATPRLGAALTSMQEYIMRETLTVDIAQSGASAPALKELQINDESCKLALQKI
ncbi:MAG: isoleucine--tRNA ligase [Bacteroidetes bacterium]|nr:isoleucine--tRNA ligase [Bacteroidota bacterium]